jgi:hypothetical protein
MAVKDFRNAGLHRIFRSVNNLYEESPGVAPRGNCQDGYRTYVSAWLIACRDKDAELYKLQHGASEKSPLLSFAFSGCILKAVYHFFY